jgi:hypothetical protein
MDKLDGGARKGLHPAVCVDREAASFTRPSPVRRAASLD